MDTMAKCFGRGWVGALLLTALVAPSVGGQVLQGRVLDELDDTPVPAALVRLLDAEGETRAVAAADSVGFYRLNVPEPGVYRLQARYLGYDGMETPLLEARAADGVYPVDLLLPRSPVPIRGLEVTAAHVDQRIKSALGRDPRSLRWEPIRRGALDGHVARAHDLTAVMRWGNYAGVEVMETTDGPCYLMRRYGCLPVYLNGFPLSAEMVDVVPLDMLYTVVLVSPVESILYPRGGVLLYTEAWLR